MSEQRPAEPETAPEAWRRMFIAHMVSKSGVDEASAVAEYDALMDGSILEEWDDMTPEEAAEECMSYWDDDGE